MQFRLAALSGLAALILSVGVGQAPGAVASATPLPLGTVTAMSAIPKDCPSGLTCSTFSVSCPAVASAAEGAVARGDARPPLRGVAVFFSGNDGKKFWSDGSEKTLPFLLGLRNSGLRVFEVRWDDPSWLQASSGEQVGPARLACRPASVIKWLHDNNTVPAATPGRCGFCISGQSAGASQVSYALARYGLDPVVSVMVPTSGPPHSDIAEGCTSNSGTPGYFPPKSSGELMDLSYGFTDGNGPCARRDSSYRTHWNADGADDNGNYFYPNTSVVFIFGDRDTNPADFHARQYVAQLRAAHSPRVSVEVIHCMSHGVQDSDQGLAAVRAALLGQPYTPQPAGAPCPNGSGKGSSSGGQDSTKGSLTKEQASGRVVAASHGSSGRWPVLFAVGIAAFVAGAFSFRLLRSWFGARP